MKRSRIVITVLLTLTVTLIVVFRSKISVQGKIADPKLWKEIDLSLLNDFIGFYPNFGDMNNDGKMDILLHRVGDKAEAGYLIAVDLDGNVLWDLGNADLPEQKYWICREDFTEPPNRALAIIYDLDHDGYSEVIAEIATDSSYVIAILDGATGMIKKSIPSPFNELRTQYSTRPHPMAFIAYMEGLDQLPTLVLKYEASNHVRGICTGYDKDLNEKWFFQNNNQSIGHIPDIADIDYDGKDEVCIGYAILDDDGSLLWEAGHPDQLADHADMVTAADILPEPGMEILIAECHRGGTAYCYSATGEILWRNSKDCDHTECIWAGNFIPERPGVELIFQQKGHTANFMSADPVTGRKIKKIRLGKHYPDWPVQVSWADRQIQSMWMPLQRSLINGNGGVDQHLGSYDRMVSEQLHAGKTKIQLGVQAFGLDICGDDREELILYQPFQGEKIFIFTQSDSDGGVKPYVHQKQAYNIRTIH
jgi:hypothetical protein